MLDAFKAGRMKRIIEMRTAEVEKALQEVVKKVCILRFFIFDGGGTIHPQRMLKSYETHP